MAAADEDPEEDDAGDEPPQAAVARARPAIAARTRERVMAGVCPDPRRVAGSRARSGDVDGDRVPAGGARGGGGGLDTRLRRPREVGGAHLQRVPARGGIPGEDPLPPGVQARLRAEARRLPRTP